MRRPYGGLYMALVAIGVLCIGLGTTVLLWPRQNDCQMTRMRPSFREVAHSPKSREEVPAPDPTSAALAASVC